MENYVGLKYTDYSILESHNSFTKNKNILIHHNGYLNLEPNQLSQIVASMDSAFAKGSTIVQYAGQQNNYAGIQKHFIPSFIINGNGYYDVQVKLKKTSNGNLSEYLPDSVIVLEPTYLLMDDPQAKVEMTDPLGRPVIISKRIGNGIYIITGTPLSNYYYNYTTFLDTTKKLLLSAFFKLKSNGEGSLLKDLLNSYKDQYTTNNINQVITFSNSDTLTNNITLTNDWVNS